MSPLRTLARPLLAAVFIRDAVQALRHPDEHVARIQRVGEAEATLTKVSEKVAEKTPPQAPTIPTNLRTIVRIHAGVTLAAGTCLALGKAPRTSATVLALTATPAAIVSHPVRTKVDRKANLGDLMSRLGLIAGLFFAAQDRAGEPSLAWRFGSWREDRQARVEAADDE